MRSVNVTETREKLAELLDAVERGEEIVIMRRERAVARLVPAGEPNAPFLDRSPLRKQLPPMNEPMEQVIRELREQERF